MSQRARNWIGVYLPRTDVEEFLDGHLRLPTDLEQVSKEELTDLLTRDEVPLSLGGDEVVADTLRQMGLQQITVEVPRGDLPQAGDLVIILHPREGGETTPLIFQVPAAEAA